MSHDEFFEACDNGDVATVRQTGAIVGVNCLSQLGDSGLMRSIIENHMPVFHYLLSLPEIDVNLTDTADDRTALQYAVYYNHEEALRALVNREDIDLTVKSGGLTAKEEAARDGKDALVAIIEEAEEAKKIRKREEVVKAPTKEESLREIGTEVAAMAGSEDLTDLTIVCKDQSFECHKFLLAIRSEVG